MSDLEQVEKILPRLSSTDKYRLLQWMVYDLSDAPPGVEIRPDVCGGEPCVTRTRIPVWVLEQARRLGKTEAQILDAYPTLHAEDLLHAWAYVRRYPQDIEKQIRENEEAVFIAS